MLVGIDARYLSHPGYGGFRTYAYGLTEGLARVSTQHRFVAYADNRPVVAPRDLRVERLGLRVPLVGAAVREQLLVPIRGRLDRIELLHSLSNTAPLVRSCPLVLTLHDVLQLASPNRHMTARDRLINRYASIVTRRVATNAAIIITVSRTTANRIVEALRVDPRKLVVTYEAPRPPFTPISPARGAADGGNPYIMAMGSRDPRKNVADVIRAYAQLPKDIRSTFRLLIVCTDGLVASSAGSLALKSRITIRTIIGPSDAELASLYRSAAAFVFPSSDEGFGLPVLEAMACGTPVIASDIPVLREIAGEAAQFFMVSDIGSLTEGIRAIIEDSSVRDRLSQLGQARSAEFSWTRCAMETIRAYELATS